MSRLPTCFTATLMSAGPLSLLVGGEGVHFLLEDGRRVIDGSDTGAASATHIPTSWQPSRRGRAPSSMTAGTRRPRRRDRRTGRVAFADDRDLVGAVRFCMSGSEANDLAMSLGQALTGRQVLVTRERAYHGGSGLSREITVQPHWHGGFSAPRRLPACAARQPGASDAMPQGARIFGARPDLSPGELTAAAVAALREPRASSSTTARAGSITTRLPGRGGGRRGRTGALWIADEVVTGFGRTGSWFAFQQADPARHHYPRQTAGRWRQSRGRRRASGRSPASSTTSAGRRSALSAGTPS